MCCRLSHPVFPFSFFRFSQQYHAETFGSHMIVFGWLALFLHFCSSARCRPSPAIAPTTKIPPALWATGGLEVVSIKISPLPTLSPGLRSDPSGSLAGEHHFHQMIQITKREPPKAQCCYPLPSCFPLFSYSRWVFFRVGRKL